jgi:O-antigen/teichoic acid export membrane protein
MILALAHRFRSLGRWRRSDLFFLANFGIAKLAVFVMPLALAAFASPRLYSGVELALAIGLQSCAVLLGAPLAGVTQLYLVRGDRQVGDVLPLITFIAALVLLAATILLWLAAANIIAVLAAAAISAVVLQNTAATWFRLRGERNRTAWADGASLLIAGIVVLGAAMIDGPDSLGLAAIGFAGTTALLMTGSAYWLLRHRVPGLRERLQRTSRVGLPMMVAGIFAIWLGVGGRILVGLTSASDLAAYSLAFRISGLALGIHQLAATTAFLTLYAARTRRSDQVMSYFLLGVLAVLVIVAVAGPFLVDFVRFSALSGRDLQIYRLLVPLTSFQTFFWIGFALLQFRINRSGSARSAIMPIVLITIGGIGVILLIARFVSHDIRVVTTLIALHAAAYFATFWVLLAKRKLPHRRVGATGLAGGLILGAIAAVRLLH